MWGMIYDGFGSYAPGLIVMPILLMTGMFAMLLALRRRN